MHRKEYNDLRATSKCPLVRHRQRPCRMDELCHASQPIGSNQLEAANVTGDEIAEARGLYTELPTLAMRVARQTKSHLKKIGLLPNRLSPDWIDNARDGLIGSSARTLSLKYVYISRDRWSSQMVFEQLSNISEWSSGLRLFLDPEFGACIRVWQHPSSLVFQ